MPFDFTFMSQNSVKEKYPLYIIFFLFVYIPFSNIVVLIYLYLYNGIL